MSSPSFSHVRTFHPAKCRLPFSCFSVGLSCSQLWCASTVCTAVVGRLHRATFRPRPNWAKYIGACCTNTVTVYTITDKLLFATNSTQNWLLHSRLFSERFQCMSGSFHFICSLVIVLHLSITIIVCAIHKSSHVVEFPVVVKYAAQWLPESESKQMNCHMNESTKYAQSRHRNSQVSK